LAMSACARDHALYSPTFTRKHATANDVANKVSNSDALPQVA